MIISFKKLATAIRQKSTIGVHTASKAAHPRLRGSITTVVAFLAVRRTRIMTSASVNGFIVTTSVLHAVTKALST